jgi:hypothetical protein
VTRPPTFLALAALAAVLFAAPLSSCDRRAPADAASAAPATPEAADTSWAAPVVERRIRSITTKDFDEFAKTDLNYKDQQTQLRLEGEKGDGQRELAAKMQEYWTTVQKPDGQTAAGHDNEFFFAFEHMKYDVDPSSEPVASTAVKEREKEKERAAPEKRRVFVTCTFASPAHAPRVPGQPKPLRSAKVSYVATPHGVDLKGYGVRIVEGSEKYFE